MVPRVLTGNVTGKSTPLAASNDVCKQLHIDDRFNRNRSSNWSQKTENDTTQGLCMQADRDMMYKVPLLELLY